MKAETDGEGGERIGKEATSSNSAPTMEQKKKQWTQINSNLKPYSRSFIPDKVAVKIFGIMQH